MPSRLALTCYVTKDGLGLLILLPVPDKCWDCRCAPPCPLAHFILLLEVESTESWVPSPADGSIGSLSSISSPIFLLVCTMLTYDSSPLAWTRNGEQGAIQSKEQDVVWWPCHKPQCNIKIKKLGMLVPTWNPSTVSRRGLLKVSCYHSIYTHIHIRLSWVT